MLVSVRRVIYAIPAGYVEKQVVFHFCVSVEFYFTGNTIRISYKSSEEILPYITPMTGQVSF